jgi:hypothetical protein
MNIIDRAKSHFESLGTQSIEVPEWKDDDGKPTIIYWNPITLSEKNKLFTLEDKIPLMHKVDSDVLSRLATSMVQAISVDEVKKN